MKGKPQKVRAKEVKDSLNLKIYKGYNNERNDLNSGQIRVKGKNTKDRWVFSPKKCLLGDIADCFELQIIV